MSGQPVSPFRRRQARWLIVGGSLLVLAGLVTRMLLGARVELVRADQVADPRDRVVHLRRAMAYYLPLNPWVHRAHDRLLTLGRDALARGDRALALDALRQLRSAILSLRGLYQPFAATLAEVNHGIVGLAVTGPAAAAQLKTPAGQAELLQRLGQPRDPSQGWAALGLLGFVLWIGSAGLLLLSGLKPDLALVGRRFWPLTVLVLCGLALFCLGMGLA